MDKSLGDILDELERLEAAESTLVFFLGTMVRMLLWAMLMKLLVPLRCGEKSNPLRRGLRVPFIAAWAKRNESSALQQRLGIPANRLSDQAGTVHDILRSLECRGFKRKR